MIEIRALSGREECAEAVRRQQHIWGFADIEVIPLRFFIVATNIGGMALGAFDKNKLVGFLLAIPGMKHHVGWPPEPYLHSHMLGVTKEYRDQGVGRLLKLEQRKIAIAQRIKLIEWTFDPFETKNAYFNIERLGAIVRRHIPNMYGITNSPLHGGLPTDRCVAEWWINSPRVLHAIAGKPDPPKLTRKIMVFEKTVEAQAHLASAFVRAQKDGLAATGFERTDLGGNYLLTPLESTD